MDSARHLAGFFLAIVGSIGSHGGARPVAAMPDPDPGAIQGRCGYGAGAVRMRFGRAASAIQVQKPPIDTRLSDLYVQFVGITAQGHGPVPLKTGTTPPGN
ncbi:hypothetical protein Busp01_39540 [Trinickia caryophylli]|nr:hypothetical protein Busp01_39540 [Trinickia caryophylli]